MPVQEEGAEALWEQEGSQPPLYYVLAAMLTMSVDSSDLPEVRTPNPHAIVGVPLSSSNKNVVVHSPAEAWPWRHTALAVHIVRLFSVLLGAGTVWTVYRLARRLFSRQPLAALGAELFVAFNPMFLFLSGAVNNDNLIILLASLALLRLVELIQGEPTRRSLQITGLVIGCACLTKLSGLALLPLAAGALALRDGRLAAGAPTTTGRAFPWGALWRAGVLRRWAASLLNIVAIAALVSGWWYLRNQCLYGYATGLGTRLTSLAGAGHAAHPERAGVNSAAAYELLGIFACSTCHRAQLGLHRADRLPIGAGRLSAGWPTAGGAKAGRRC